MTAITFAWPQMIPLLAIPIMLGFWQWFARGHQTPVPFDHAEIPPRRFVGALLRMFSFLPAALLLVGLLLLARPLREGPPNYPQKVANIQIVLDTSGSMNEPFGSKVHADGNPYTRFDAAMDAINNFTRAREGDAFGLSIFTEKVIHWTPLTTDLSAIRLSTPFVRPGAFPLEWWDRTLVGNAIRTAAELLVQRSEGDRMMIVLTDGETRDMEGALAVELGQELRANDIVLYAISVRAEGASDDLRTACDLTGGQLFESGDIPDLQEVFRNIDQLQPTQLEAAQPRWLRFDYPFALAGLSLLALSLIAACGVRYTPW